MTPRQKFSLSILLAATSASCAINFELTSQRTALENQILGSYEEINDELYMISSVRALDKEKAAQSSLEEKAKFSRQNQIFNQDDIDELKTAQILGEGADGTLQILPAGIGLASQATPAQKQLAQLLIKEENNDRQVVWQYTIATNENLKPQDLPKVRQTFAEQMFIKGKPGQWFQNEGKGWSQKTDPKVTTNTNDSEGANAAKNNTEKK